jgi:hypothetical protein
MSFLNKRRTSLTLVAILVATVLVGVLQGRLSRRWGTPADVASFGEKLDSIPTRIGSWQLESSDELEEEVQKILNCEGSLKRRYVNVDTGAAVNVALLLGPSGPIAVHTPEICYSSRDFTIDGEKKVVPLKASGEKPDEFWAIKFRGKNVAADHLQVYYGWSTGEEWSAPESSRFAFSGQPWLYKIQVAASTTGAGESDTDPCRDFLEAFVPAIRSTLVSTKG